MSLTTPTTDGLATTIVSQLEASLSASTPFLPKAFLRVLAKVFAGVVIILYKYCGFIFLQLFVAYASDQPTTVNGRVIIPLVEWGRQLGVGDPEPAEQAQLLISVVVQNQTGALPANSSLLFATSGVLYQTVAEVPLNAPVVPVAVRAVSDQAGGDGSGTIGNLQPGAVLEFSSPPPNVATRASVVSQLVTGADAESSSSYRSRILQRTRARPQGGAYADYREWALTVPGIVNAYPYASSRPGEVDVYVEASVDSSGDPDGIPTNAQLSAVLTAINLDNADGKATRRPVNAAVNTLPITRVAFDLLITGLDPVDSNTKDSIQDGVDEFLRSREPFIVGLSILPRADRITQAAVGGIVDGVVDAAGASVTTVTMSPGPAFTLNTGQKAKRGNVVFA